MGCSVLCCLLHPLPELTRSALPVACGQSESIGINESFAALSIQNLAERMSSLSELRLGKLRSRQQFQGALLPGMDLQ